MKFVCIALLLFLSFACMANPRMRTYTKRAPLTGKVKTVCHYALRTANEAEVREWGKNTHSVDSYSNTGQKVLSYYIQSGELSGKWLYAYNDKGKLIEEKYFDEGDSLQSQKKYSYDSIGNLVLEKELVSGSPWMGVSYMYTAGLLTEKIYNGVYLQRKDIYKYNEKGKMIEQREISPGSDDMVTRYSYYDNGNMRSETYAFSFGDAITTYTYDEHNNEILAVEGTEGTGRKFASEYVYDKQGNWIRCLEEVPNDWQNDNQLTIREIAYY